MTKYWKNLDFQSPKTDLRTEILVVGAGIFGSTVAIELSRRGYKTTLLDEGLAPNPLAASTDISKVIRMEYGRDPQYAEMVAESIVGFRLWNDEFGQELYHETGVVSLSTTPMNPGGFEHDSYETLRKQGFDLTRLNSEEITKRFPALKKGVYVDGIFNPVGGFAESGKILSQLYQKARSAGVNRVADRLQSLISTNSRVTGVQLTSGSSIGADHVVLATGAWTPIILPELADFMVVTGHPVFHLRIDDPKLFSPPLLPTFLTDVARTGWYGFPYHPDEHVLKLGNHGVGRLLHPEHDERVLDDVDIKAMRQFLESTFPSLVDAPVVYTRLCLYCDCHDEHFWIDRHPVMEGLTVAAGGSGHAFKFAPILGTLIADAVEQIPNAWLPRFAWRNLTERVQGEEAARYRG